jgi:heme-degrading monooxygenase HmoA
MSLFVAAYWWEVHPDKEDQFRAAWRRGTELIREKYGSFGSRLHKELREDGTLRYVGVAEWPDEATWRHAFDAKMEYDDPPTRRAFLDAISRAADEPLLLMEVTDDLLLAGNREPPE